MTTLERKCPQQKRGLVILGIEIRPTKILEEFSGRRLLGQKKALVLEIENL